MPLRDHFEHPTRRTWEKIHGMWPAVMAQHLFRTLPPRYHVAAQVHLGQYFKVDIAAYDADPDGQLPSGSDSSGGGLATAVWAPPEPTLTLETDLRDPDEYEVRIFDAEDGQRLVAVIELVGPSNKDRPESRRAFVAKCAALLQQDVCVSIVDLVTVRQFNLYADLLDLLGRNHLGKGRALAFGLLGPGLRRQRPAQRGECAATDQGATQPAPGMPCAAAGRRPCQTGRGYTGVGVELGAG